MSTIFTSRGDSPAALIIGAAMSANSDSVSASRRIDCAAAGCAQTRTVTAKAAIRRFMLPLST
eukprot:9660153-Prorocentrum_lima.AAC.1